MRAFALLSTFMVYIVLVLVLGVSRAKKESPAVPLPTVSTNLCCESTSVATEYFNNIDFLSLGYNIYEGFPLSQAGLDPGFKTAKIFDLQETEDTTSDKRFYIPDGVSIVKELACQLSFDSEEISSEQNLQNHLKLHASASGKSLYGSFQFSGEYENLKKEFSSVKSLHVFSKGECQVYKASLNTHNPPKLSSYFINDVKNLLLPALSDPTKLDNFLSFIQIYGTHFVQEMTMGAKLSIIKNVNANKGQTFGSTSVSLATSASYSNVYSFSGDFTYSHQREAAEAFEKTVISTKTSTIGSRPPADGDANVWAQQSFIDPMPLTYNLQNIKDLLDPLFLGDALSNTTNYTALQTYMEKATEDYCAKKAEELQLDSSIYCTAVSDEDYFSQFKFIIAQTPTYGYSTPKYNESSDIASWGIATKKIQLKYKDKYKLQAIRVVMSDQDENDNGNWVGTVENNQQLVEYIVPEGHKIAAVRIWTGPKIIKGLAFVTEDGQFSKTFGSRDATEYYTVDIKGILSGFNGHLRDDDDGSTYLSSIGFKYFDYSTPAQAAKPVIYATPLYGNPTNTPFFQVYDLEAAKVQITIVSGNLVEYVGINFTYANGTTTPTQSFGLYTGNGEHNPPEQYNTIKFWYDYDFEGFIDIIQGIDFVDGATLKEQAGSNRGKQLQIFNVDDYGNLELKGVYGRVANNGFINNIGFIYARSL